MDELFTVRITLVLDRRAEPLVGELRSSGASHASSQELRELAAHLRSLRPAWREIGIATFKGRRDELHVTADGDGLRVDVFVVSRQPLIVAPSYSFEDARVKLEAISSAQGVVIDSIETHVYRTAYGHDAQLHAVPSQEFWYCAYCGTPSLDEVERCPACGRARDPALWDEEPARVAA